MGYFSCRELLECQLCLWHQIKMGKMDKGKRLKMDVKMFFWRKNVVISELDFALEVFTTAFCIELNFMQLRKVDFMVMLMFKTM